MGLVLFCQGAMLTCLLAAAIIRAGGLGQTSARPVADQCQTSARSVPDQCQTSVYQWLGQNSAKTVPDQWQTSGRPVNTSEHARKHRTFRCRQVGEKDNKRGDTRAECVGGVAARDTRLASPPCTASPACITTMYCRPTRMCSRHNVW